jgi:uncharacterized protein
VTVTTRPARLPLYRNVKAGLDHAVRQAEERNLFSFPVVDADCHQKEPFRLFEKYLPSEYRKVLFGPDPVGDPLQNYAKGQHASKAAAGRLEKTSSFGGGRIKRTESTYPRPTGPDELIETFAHRMLEIGIKNSVVLPSSMLYLGMDDRPPEFHLEVSKAYIHYMIDYFLDKYSPEILTCIYVDGLLPEKCAELIDDVGSEKGVVGIIIPGLTQTFPGSDEWNPIYDAAQQKDLPVCFHGVEYLGKSFFLSKMSTYLSSHVLSFPFGLAAQLTSLVLDGVPERYPRLKFCFMEGGVTWIPWLMQRIDDEYTKRKYDAPLLSKLPSEYMKEFYYTSQPLESAHKNDLEGVFSSFNAETQLLYASDYPHWDFDVPSVIYDLPFLTETAKKKILGENASKLFKIS